MDLNQKFDKEMFIDCLAELANKYRARLPAAAACVSTVAIAVRAGEDAHLAQFLAQFMKIFEQSVNGKEKAHATAKPSNAQARRQF